MDKRYLRLGTAVSDNSIPMLSKIFQLLFVLFFLKGVGGGGGLIVSGVENYQTFKLGSEGVKPKK